MPAVSRADIRLYTANTMNGWKPLIFLHEAGIDYELIPISFAKREQKSDWYLKLNPNGRIPTIVDKTLVAWVSLADTTQRAGSALTLIDPAERFDAIVFAEIEPGKWMAGSDHFQRTQREQSAFPVERPHRNARSKTRKRGIIVRRSRM